MILLKLVKNVKIMGRIVLGGIIIVGGRKSYQNPYYPIVVNDAPNPEINLKNPPNASKPPNAPNLAKSIVGISSLCL
jgi:hypothetical protein